MYTLTSMISTSLCLHMVLRLSILSAGVFDKPVIVCLKSTFYTGGWVGAFTPPTRQFIGNWQVKDKLLLDFIV